MVQIRIYKKDAGKIMDIVGELRAKGWVQSVDFDFAFNQSSWDAMIGEISKFTVFTFYTEKYATMFALKYSS
jgi:hypothetical protein